MGYIVMGEEGSFTAHSGDALYTNMFGVDNAEGRVTVNSAVLNIASASHDVTALLATNAKTLSGLASANATVSGFIYPLSRVGNLGLVSCTNPAFYAANAFRWNLNIRPLAVQLITAYHFSDPGSGPTWHSFRPSPIVVWDGSFSCRFETDTILRTGSSGTVPIQPPSITDDSSTDFSNLVLSYGDSATDESFSGEAQITGYGIPIVRGNVIEMTFGFRGSGPLTAAGTNNIFSGTGINGSGHVLGPVWSGNAAGNAPFVARFFEKVATTTRYHETTDMFWTRIGIDAQVDQPVSFSMDFQCSGPVTVQ